MIRAKHWRYIFLSVILVLIAFGTRIYQLDHQSFWNDEALSYINTTRTISEMNAVIASDDFQPPGYYYGLRAWSLVFGRSEFSLRYLSVLVSTLGVAFTYALGKRLFHPIAGLVAASIVILNTFNLYYGQEARMYAQLATAAVATTWAFVGIVQSYMWKRPTRVWLWTALYTIFTIIGLYTHYTYPLVMIAQGGMFVLALGMIVQAKGLAAIRSPLIWFIFANLVAILVFSPWIQIGIRQLTAARLQPNWGYTGSTDQILFSAQGLLLYGETFTHQLSASVIAFYGLLAFGLFTPATIRSPFRRWRKWLPIVWVLVGVGGYLIANLNDRQLRFLIPVQIAVALWMGRGVWVLWELPPRRPQHHQLLKLATIGIVGAVLLVLASGLPLLYNDIAFQRDDYRSMAAYVTEHAQAGDAVVLNSPSQHIVFNYYYEGDLPVYGLPASPDDEAQGQQDVRQVITDHDRIFVLYWGEPERDFHRVVESTLSAEAFPVQQDWYGDVRLVQYATPEELGEAQSIDARFSDTIELHSYQTNANSPQPGEVLQVTLAWQANSQIEKSYKVFVHVFGCKWCLSCTT